MSELSDILKKAEIADVPDVADVDYDTTNDGDVLWLCHHRNGLAV